MSGGGTGLMSGGGVSIGSGGRGKSGCGRLFDHVVRCATTCLEPSARMLSMHWCLVVADASLSHIQSDRAHQRQRVAALDDAGPHPVVEHHRAVLDPILEVHVGRAAVRASAASSVSARSCVVTRPIAPASTSARTIASAPIRRSCELVPRGSRRAGTAAAAARARASTIAADAQNLGVEARVPRLQRVVDPQRRADRQRRQRQRSPPAPAPRPAPARR